MNKNFYKKITEENEEIEIKDEGEEKEFCCLEDTTVDIESTLNTFSFYNRSLYINEPIENSHAKSIHKFFKLWNTADEAEEIPVEDRTPIKIYINTPGGDLNAVFSIINSITSSKTPVYTVTIGSGYSGGFFIGIVGHKRFAYPYSSFLFHEGMIVEDGDAHKFLQKAEFYKKQLASLENIVLKHTKITKKIYEKNKKNDWYFDSEEALQYGIIDEIINEI